MSATDARSVPTGGSNASHPGPSRAARGAAPRGLAAFGALSAGVCAVRMRAAGETATRGTRAGVRTDGGARPPIAGARSAAPPPASSSKATIGGVKVHGLSRNIEWEEKEIYMMAYWVFGELFIILSE